MKKVLDAENQSSSEGNQPKSLTKMYQMSELTADTIRKALGKLPYDTVAPIINFWNNNVFEVKVPDQTIKNQ